MSKSKPPPTRAAFLTGLTYAGIYGGLLVPVVFAPGLVVFPYVFLKMLFLQVLIALTLPAFIALALLEPRVRPRPSILYGALAAYLAALGLSALFAYDKARAFFGNQERMSGLFTLLHLAAWLVMTSSVLKTWPQWRRLLDVQAALGFLMALVALLQKPFPEMLGHEVGARVSGLLGNAIYSGAYHLFAAFFAGLLLARASSPRARRLYSVALLTSLAALWASGSRGALLGLVVGASAAAAIWAVHSGRRKAIWLLVGSLALAVALYAFVAGVLIPLQSLEAFWRDHGLLAHVFTADFDPARQNLWKVAWQGFRDHPWVGWGLNNFEVAYDVHYSPWFMCWGSGGTLQDSSHSLVFDLLASAGVVGLSAFALLWASVFRGLTRGLRSGHLSLAAGAVLFGLAAAYLVQGLFVFDNPGSWSMSYLLIALSVAVARPEFAMAVEPKAAVEAPLARGLALPAFVALEALGVLLAWRASLLPAQASYANKATFAAFKRGDCAAALRKATAAAKIPTPYVEDQVYTLSKGLGGLSEKNKLDLCPQWPQLLDQARAVENRHARIHGDHARQRAMFATLLLSLARTTKQPPLLAQAGEQFERLLAESPRRQQHQYDYAGWLVEAGRLKEAQAHLEFALNQYETSGESIWRLGVFKWRSLKQPGAGAELMRKAVLGKECPYGPKSAMETQQLAQAYWTLGDRERLKGLVKAVEDFSKDDRPTIVHLGIARYLEKSGLLGERDRVLRIAEERDPPLSAKLRSLREGRVKSVAEIEQSFAGAAESARGLATPPGAPLPAPIPAPGG